MLKAIQLIALLGGLEYVQSTNVGSWIRLNRADSNLPVTAGILVKEKNLETLEQLFNERTDPTHIDYAKWMTRTEIGNLVFNELAQKQVLSFLVAHNVTFAPLGEFASYIKVTMPVWKAEELFQTEFYEYSSEDYGFKIVKTEKFTVPVDIDLNVEHVEHISHFPKKQSRMISYANLPTDQVVTPDLIYKTYNVPSTPVAAGSKSTQSLFESLDQNFAPKDLTVFQNKFNLKKSKVAKVIGDNDPNSCYRDPDTCGEANLDVQYIMAVAQGVPTWYWFVEGNVEPFVEWINAVNNLDSPPLVHSISYGDYENSEKPGQLKAFNTAAQKLGLRGVTIIVASGDDGAVNYNVRNNTGACGYFPSFPSSSPFVTSVGATQGPEAGSDEVACSSRTGGLITTGGGFSNVFQTPQWQQSDVSTYLTSIKSKIPSGYASGRGTPDVSALGHNYVIAVGGELILVSGTSASAPVFAGMIARINDARLRAGKPSLGFLNPALYKADRSIYNDVTKGDSFCAATHTPGSSCCKQGFYAAKGWDPLTGLGTPQFDKLQNYLANL
jgi:tripeptidyl-peptidase-1